MPFFNLYFGLVRKISYPASERRFFRFFYKSPECIAFHYSKIYTQISSLRFYLGIAQIRLVRSMLLQITYAKQG